MRQVDKHKAMAYFERVSRSYDDTVSKGILSLPRRLERRAVLELCGMDRCGPRVLDVGCGAGFYSLHAKALGKNVTATDSSLGMINSVEKKVDRAMVIDLEKNAFDSQYDLVVCAGVLDFVLDPVVAFSNLASAVVSGGYLVVLSPRQGFGGFLYRIEKFFFGFRVNLFSVKWYEERAKGTGLKLLEVRKPLPTNLAIRFQKP